MTDGSDVFDEKAISAIWDANAAAWLPVVYRRIDPTFEFIDKRLFFESFLPHQAGRELIDLGCGEGRVARLLAQQGARVTGIDISAKLIAAGRTAEASEPLGIRYFVGSFTSLADFETASFDTAVSRLAFMDGPDFPKAAREAYRVLRPAGELYFSVLHPCFRSKGANWPKSRNGAILGRLVRNYWDERPFVTRVGFSGDERVLMPHFPYRLEHYVNALTEAGFLITKVAEPRITEEMVAANPNFLRPWRDHAPLFLYVAAAKS